MGNPYLPTSSCEESREPSSSADLTSESWTVNSGNAHTKEYDIKDQLEEIAWGLTFGDAYLLGGARF